MQQRGRENYSSVEPSLISIIARVPSDTPCGDRSAISADSRETFCCFSVLLRLHNNSVNKLSIKINARALPGRNFRSIRNIFPSIIGSPKKQTPTARSLKCPFRGYDNFYSRSEFIKIRRQRRGRRMAAVISLFVFWASSNKKQKT